MQYQELLSECIWENQQSMDLYKRQQVITSSLLISNNKKNRDIGGGN
jgi:hypothetical protein